MGLEFEIPSSILPRCHDRGKRGEGVVDKNDGQNPHPHRDTQPHHHDHESNITPGSQKSARENIHKAVCIMMGKIIISNVHLWTLFIITIGFFITFDYCHDDRQLLNYN